MPLFLLSIVLVAFGVVIGSLATWLKQHRWRVRARHAEQEARELREQLAGRSWPAGDAGTAPQPAPLSFPPAA
jgi:hypothetical protein